MRRHHLKAIAASLFVALVPSLVRTNAVAAPFDPPKAAASAKPPEDENTKKARAEFVSGRELADNQQWGEALAAFERSIALKRHSLTIFNVGVCERNLGHYTRARRTLKEALAQNETNGGMELPKSYAADAAAYLSDIDGLLVRVEVTIAPADASLAVDGRPLAVESNESKSTVLVAGIEPAGPGAVPPKSTFGLLVDPGTRVFTITRKGFTDVRVSKSFKAGSKGELHLEAEKLPTTIRVKSDREGAVVTLAGLDLGVAPIDVTRPSGSYELVVTKPGFVTYRSTIVARPGEELNLSAALPEETIPMTKKWWFWTAAGVVLTGAAVGTYLLTRPAPERPEADGGGLGWVVSIK